VATDDPRRELHVRRDARERYRIDEPVFASPGDAARTDLLFARQLAHRINSSRNLIRHPGDAVRASDLNAMGILHTVFREVLDLYRAEYGSATTATALEVLNEKFSASDVTACLTEFVSRFPPAAVFTGHTDAEALLAADLGGRSGREALLEGIALLSLANENPALRPFAELIGDDELGKATAYPDIIDELGKYYRRCPPFGPDSQSLLEMLRTPARLYPNSLEDQLAYIYERWGSFLGDQVYRLLRGLDVLREDGRVRLPGPGPSRIHQYDGAEPERFSPDQDWMPGVVLIAKSALVWLDQLSRTHQTEITRLDQIPDQELDRLASWGVTGLWLIGLWQRSRASREIKQRMGNAEAEASAYALYDYTIADELGGWDALDSLRARASRRGIRLASDMVPNHTGIDGRWVVEHPDWFIQLGHPPFPSYSFSSEDLSSSADVAVQLEDHYYSRSDAAVVFKRTDRHSGEARYIYHGNDGTSMPWNDTAQLDYLKAEVREAVMQTILHVARHFPIIRFDAAMTLAKKHIRRLWYPEPGSGGAIPSRSEYGLSASDFEAAIPREFWREVVDRVAAEVPDTLLLAEAFWMMEGYFVRTLGMHRVYNSAFMNMLKNEENQKYRQVIKNTIEFDKEILKRFVNFMNNPDEETAIAQFGTGDKYFGVCTLMVTMPGLPMFGHGQVEGFAEKYGMEYRRAYWDEMPNGALIERHERDIFPLMRRRHLFSGVSDFLLFDLMDGGSVNDNVFVYTNRAGSERSLVTYNNSLSRAHGWIRTSCLFAERLDNDKKEHRRAELADALGLQRSEERYCIFREHAGGLWYLRSSAEIRERGLYVELSGYQCQVFLDFHEVTDNEYGHYAQLVDELDGRGVDSVEESIREIALKPLLDLHSAIANSHTYRIVSKAITGERTVDAPFIDALEHSFREFLRLAAQYRPQDAPIDAAVDRLGRLLGAIQEAAFLDLVPPPARAARFRKATAMFCRSLRDQQERRDQLITWALLEPLASVYELPVGVVEEWGLIRHASRAFHGQTRDPAWMLLMKILINHGTWWTPEAVDNPGRLIENLLSDVDVSTFVAVNEYDEVVWFNGERLDELTWWIYATGVVSIFTATPAEERAESVLALYEMVETIGTAREASGYKVDAFLDALSDGEDEEGPLE